jgi:glutamate synthase domain-containing protein 2
VVLINWLIKRMLQKNINRLLTTAYEQSLWEGVAGISHHGIMNIMENEYRANTPYALTKPIGASNRFPHFDGLLFNTGQLYRPPLLTNQKVDLSCTLGKRCARPMKLAMPIMISGMGYGVALSKQVSLALARASGEAGIAFNIGQGAYLNEYRQLAHRLILQIHGSAWEAKGDVLQKADAIEIKVGQGANGGVQAVIYPETFHQFDQEVMSDLGLQRHDPEKPIYLPSSSQMINSHGGLNVLIQRLHTEVPGVPVIVKLAAGNDLEQDMEIAIQAGADVLAIDGAQGGTHGSPSILVNDFGLPTLHALVRAVRYLRQTGYNQQVDLVISGGLRTPGDVLKALALGASAVYFGTAALYAATHAQLAKTLPFDPPTAITWSSGKLKDNFDAQKGSESLLNFLVSFADELQFGLQSLGKATLQELSADDLFAWDERVARVTGLPLG